MVLHAWSRVGLQEGACCRRLNLTKVLAGSQEIDEGIAELQKLRALIEKETKGLGA
jgi:hypothetical protein